MKIEIGPEGPSITVGGTRVELKCPKCGGKRIRTEGGTITEKGMQGNTITCLDCRNSSGNSQSSNVKV